VPYASARTSDHSVSRPGLTRTLLDHARRRYGVEPRFLQVARGLDFERDELVSWTRSRVSRTHCAWRR